MKCDHVVTAIQKWVSTETATIRWGHGGSSGVVDSRGGKICKKKNEF
jgi:hypothetical protein